MEEGKRGEGDEGKRQEGDKEEQKSLIRWEGGEVEGGALSHREEVFSKLHLWGRWPESDGKSRDKDRDKGRRKVSSEFREDGTTEDGDSNSSRSTKAKAKEDGFIRSSSSRRDG